MNKNIIFLIVLGLTIGTISTIHAQTGKDYNTTRSNTAVILQEEEITLEDLNVETPSLLPTSRLYFFKEWGRGIRRIFTFDAVKKAELELRFADEKIAEAKVVADTRSEEATALAGAIENYRAAQERLKARIETLTETSENPNLDRLLEKIADRTIKHEKLFDELAAETKHDAVINSIRNIHIRITNTAIAAAKKEDSEAFARRIEKTLINAKGSDLRHVRSVEILDRIVSRADTDQKLKEKLEAIRRDFTTRFEDDLKRFTDEHATDAPEALRDALEKLPGDKARRLALLKELRERAEDHVRDAIDDAEDALEDFVEAREDVEERAQEALEDAREKIEKLETLLVRADDIPDAVDRLAKNARNNFENARRAWNDQKWGEAFGQAHSAEALARNALRLLEEDHPERGDLKEDITDLEEDLREWELEIEKLSGGFREEARSALENSRLHLRLAAENFEKKELREAKKHLGEAEEFERKLERVFHSSRRGDAPHDRARATDSPRIIACPSVVVPSCEENQSSDACRREVKQLTDMYPGCGFEKRFIPSSDDEGKDEKGNDGREDKTSRPELCAEVYRPVCGSNGKTYSNACYAKRDNVTVRHEGECDRKLPPVDESPRPLDRTDREKTSNDAVTPADAEPKRETPTATTPAPVTPTLVEHKIEADDSGFYPTNTLTVPKGSRVRLTLMVRETGVYFAGLHFRSPKFKTEDVDPGGSTTVEFDANESFTITSYWPSSGVKKADLKVTVE